MPRCGAVVAERRHLLEGACSAPADLLPAGCSATNPQHAAAAVDRRDRLTDSVKKSQLSSLDFAMNRFLMKLFSIAIWK